MERMERAIQCQSTHKTDDINRAFSITIQAPMTFIKMKEGLLSRHAVLYEENVETYLCKLQGEIYP